MVFTSSSPYFVGEQNLWRMNKKADEEEKSPPKKNEHRDTKKKALQVVSSNHIRIYTRCSSPFKFTANLCKSFGILFIN